MADQDQFSDLEKNLSNFTRAIGHPARVAILLSMAKKGFRIQGEIIDVPALSKATVLQHLRELKRAGFIQGRIFGAKAEYQLNQDLLQKFEKDLLDFFESVSKKPNSTDLH